MFLVLSLPKPSFTLDTDIPGSTYSDDHQLVLPPLCAGSSGYFKVNFVGKPPFKFQYLHVHKSSSEHSEESEYINIELQTYFAQLSLNSTAGLHYYKLHSVSDDNYKNILPNNIDQLPIVITQQVSSAPSAIFTDSQPRIVHCISRGREEFTLEMSLIGLPPFLIDVEERRDKIYLSNIKITVTENELISFGSGYKFILKTEGQSAMGKYQYIILSVAVRCF
jgi:hypothetical protein